jgi:hypothetical protein
VDYICGLGSTVFFFLPSRSSPSRFIILHTLKMVSTLAALALTFGLAHSAVLPGPPKGGPAPPKGGPPPPPPPPKGATPPPPPGPPGPPPPPPGPYHSLSGSSVVVVTSTAGSTIESSGTAIPTSASETLITSSSTSSACPTGLFTTTTATETETGTIYAYTTVTASPSTSVVSSDSYITTISSSLGDVSTETSFLYTATTTDTYYEDIVSVGTCTSTSTV